MTDEPSILEDEPAPAAVTSPETPPEAATTSQPTYIPDKFWDPDAGVVRTEALAKSYQELERRLGEPPADIPTDPTGYEIEAPKGFEDILASDAAVNAQLHEAGFSQQQASLVYQLAAERLVPMVQTVAEDLRHGRETAEVVNKLGGENKWRELKPQIAQWGRANLPPETFSALSTSAAGILAMRQMMQSKEPALLNRGDVNGAVLSEAELKRMMQDPRYWRDEDPAYVARVQQGFEALYPD